MSPLSDLSSDYISLDVSSGSSFENCWDSSQVKSDLMFPLIQTAFTHILTSCPPLIVSFGFWKKIKGENNWTMKYDTVVQCNHRNYFWIYGSMTLKQKGRRRYPGIGVFSLSRFANTIYLIQDDLTFIILTIFALIWQDGGLWWPLPPF